MRANFAFLRFTGMMGESGGPTAVPSPVRRPRLAPGDDTRLAAPFGYGLVSVRKGAWLLLVGMKAVELVKPICCGVSIMKGAMKMPKPARSTVLSFRV